MNKLKLVAVGFVAAAVMSAVGVWALGHEPELPKTYCKLIAPGTPGARCVFERSALPEVKGHALLIIHLNPSHIRRLHASLHLVQHIDMPGAVGGEVLKASIQGVDAKTEPVNFELVTH